MQQWDLAPRARIGVLLPSVNTVVEPFFARAVPERVTVHAGRMPIGGAATLQAAQEMDRHGRAAVEVLATCRPDVIVYACVASGLVRGRTYDRQLIAEFTELTGTQTVSATDAVVQALSHLGARRISVASPYVEEIERTEAAYFESADIEVVSSASLGIDSTHALAECPPTEIAKLAHHAWGHGSDALFVACLNLHSHLVIETLEAELGRPVVTATQAALWSALRAAGVFEPIPGLGLLLSEAGMA